MIDGLSLKKISAYAVLAVFFFLCFAYAVRIVPGDAPDERAHAEYAMSLRNGSLPIWNWPAAPFSYEAFQPPLYYYAAGQLLKISSGLDLRNQVTALRLLSALLHVGALAALWQMLLRINPKKEPAPLGPLYAMAALPMFAFIGASITNDAAANFAGAWLLWLAVCPDRVSDSLRPIILGLFIGVALLCKLTTVVPALVCLYALWSANKLSRRDLAAAIALSALICGWFYLRNTLLYGDPTGTRLIQRYDHDRYAWNELGEWLLFYFQSFWGRFGLMTQPMRPAAYVVAALATAVAIAGWVWRWPDILIKPGRKILLAAYALTIAQNFYYGFFMTRQPQARYSFVALAAWAVLFWDGISIWTQKMEPKTASAVYGGLTCGALLLQYCAWRAL